MLDQIEVLRITRNNILKLANNFTLEELNRIPEGFNNNLMWNLGHVLVTQQLLCYGLSSLPMAFEQDVIDSFRKGSKPEGDVDEASYLHFREMAHRTIKQLEQDLEAKRFQKFREYPTSYGVTLHNIESAIQFNNLHEAMHLGTMIALTRAL